jgi:ParB-like chromosome segregation protein Spo0J
MTKQVRWKVDDQATEILRQHGVSWSVTTVDDSQIDLDQSRHNGARQVAIDKLQVQDYVSAMESGDTFPCITLARIEGRGKYIIVGGNHRHAAATSLGCKSFLAICLDCDARDFHLLRIGLNATHGLSETREMRIQQAVELVLSQNMRAAEVSSLLRLPPSTINQAVRVRELESSIVRAGLSKTGINETNMLNLTRLAKEARLLPLGLELARSAATTSEVRDVIKDAMQQPTEEQRIEYIADALRRFGPQPDKPTKSVRVRRVRSQVAHHLTALENISEKVADLCQAQMSSQEAAVMSDRLMKLADYFASLTDGLPTVESDSRKSCHAASMMQSVN